MPQYWKKEKKNTKNVGPSLDVKNEFKIKLHL
jgi:hypothetical protein